MKLSYFYLRDAVDEKPQVSHPKATKPCKSKKWTLSYL